MAFIIAPVLGVPRLQATGPNQRRTWDITELRGPVPRQWFFLYAIVDIYSRKRVGWQVSHLARFRSALERRQRSLGNDAGATSIANERDAPRCSPGL